MKVLVVAYRFLPEVGGYETLVDEISKRLGSHNIDVVVACFTTRSDLPSEERIGNLRVFRHFVRATRLMPVRRIEWRFAGLVDRILRYKSGVGKPLALLTQFFVNNSYVPCLALSSSKWLLRVMSSEQPDVVHVFSPRMAVSLYPVAFLTRVPIVVTFPGTFWMRWSRDRCYDKLCYCLSYDWYLMHEDGTGAAIKAEKMGIKSVSSFFSGVDTTLFDPIHVSGTEIRESLGINEDSVVFGILGRIEPTKGVREVVASFLDWAEVGDNLLVAGEVRDSRYYSEILALVKGHRNERRIKFIGPIEHSRIPEFLAACDVIVLNGQLTNFNLTFAEALMMGKPIIVNANGLGVFREQLKRCPTVLLHDGTVSELKIAFRKIKESGTGPQVSMAEHTLAIDSFTWAGAVGKITAAYEAILS